LVSEDERWPHREVDHGALSDARSFSCPDGADGPLRPTTGVDMEREVDLLSDNELDAVAGGTVNSGQGHFLPKPPIKGGPVHSIPGGILEGAAIFGS
jgi:hypothetical protein